MTGPDLFQSLTSSLLVRLVFALALLLASGALVWSTLRFRRDKIKARLALIEPAANAALVSPEHLSEAMDEAQQDAKLTREQREFARRLRGVGVATRFAPAVLVAAQVGGAVCAAALCWVLIPASTFPLLRMLLAASALFLGWFLPSFVAHRAATSRAAAVVAGLPDALELLVICAEGGLALGDGIDRIVKQLKRSRPELAEEFVSTAADLKMLPSQELALARLAARVDDPIVQSVVTTLGQTMRYGTPFAKAMRIMATEMRDESLIRLEERANSLPAFLTISMILFILPTILLVVGGPAVLHLTDVVAAR